MLGWARIQVKYTKALSIYDAGRRQVQRNFAQLLFEATEPRLPLHIVRVLLSIRTVLAGNRQCQAKRSPPRVTEVSPPNRGFFAACPGPCNNRISPTLSWGTRLTCSRAGDCKNEESPSFMEGDERRRPSVHRGRRALRDHCPDLYGLAWQQPRSAQIPVLSDHCARGFTTESELARHNGHDVGEFPVSVAGRAGT